MAIIKLNEKEIASGDEKGIIKKWDYKLEKA